MAMIASDETVIQTSPQKFAIAENTKLLTFIKGEPPVVAGQGRRANPVVTEIYKTLLTRRNEWAHVNIAITSKKQLESLRVSFYNRAKKDNLNMATSSIYNEKTKLFDLWVMLSA